MHGNDPAKWISDYNNITAKLAKADLFRSATTNPRSHVTAENRDPPKELPTMMGSLRTFVRNEGLGANDEHTGHSAALSAQHVPLTPENVPQSQPSARSVTRKATVGALA
jgi:hypothetical protein